MTREEVVYELCKWAGFCSILPPRDWDLAPEVRQVIIIDGDAEPHMGPISGLWRPVEVGRNFLAHYGLVQYFVKWE